MAWKTRDLFVVSRGTQRNRPECVGVSGRGEEVQDRRRLHDAAGVHDDHPVAVPGDDAQVVRDQDGAEVRARDQVVESSRICAWMVTSSAVVGSSAMSSLGRQAMARAIITR